MKTDKNNHYMRCKLIISLFLCEGMQKRGYVYLLILYRVNNFCQFTVIPNVNSTKNTLRWKAIPKKYYLPC